jgi:hypothetical protein
VSSLQSNFMRSFFCFNHLVDGGVHKMFTVEGQGLHWENGKWLDEGNVV